MGETHVYKYWHLSEKLKWSHKKSHSTLSDFFVQYSNQPPFFVLWVDRDPDRLATAPEFLGAEADISLR